MSQEFLPGAFSHQSMLMVIAGQEKAAYNPKKEGVRIFHLNGLSVDWFKILCQRTQSPYRRAGNSTVTYRLERMPAKLL